MILLLKTSFGNTNASYWTLLSTFTRCLPAAGLHYESTLSRVGSKGCTWCRVEVPTHLSRYLDHLAHYAAISLASGIWFNLYLFYEMSFVEDEV
jgi:hypothetical protein